MAKVYHKSKTYVNALTGRLSAVAYFCEHGDVTSGSTKQTKKHGIFKISFNTIVSNKPMSLMLSLTLAFPYQNVVLFRFAQ
jgi:hypothetical protein